MVDSIETTANALAAGQSALAAVQHVFGVVTSVNADGTVTVEDGRGTRTSVRCLQAYSPRARGDSVLVIVTAAGPVVLGAIGGATPDRPFTLSDSAAPGGAGWEQTVTGQVWAKIDGAQWQKRITPAPPPTGGSVTLTATALATYRGGGVTQMGKAEQGDYSGLGLQTGLAVFGSWAGLSGQTALGGVLTIHRSGSGHGFTYGAVAATARPCSAATVPVVTPSLSAATAVVAAALNETQSIGLPAAWCQPFCTGGANAVGFYSDNAADNIEIDSVTLTVSY